MKLRAGQTVVHPFHGPVLVTDLTDRTVRGTARRYVHLEAAEPPLKISLPIDQLDDAGVRVLSSPQRVAELLDLLGAPSQATERGWSRRMKDLREHLSTGRPEDLCYVVREIVLQGPRPPASAEGMMLKEARARLASEFSLALRVTPDEAERIIQTAVLDTIPA